MIKLTSIFVGLLIAAVVNAGAFTASDSCPHAKRIKQLNQNSDLPELVVGKKYHAISYNTAERKFIRVSVPSHGERWTSASCGLAEGEIKVNQSSRRTQNTVGEFHHYKLALSYSPEFCIASDDREQAQCKMTWIVHGLWPQHKKGYPADCKVESSMVDDIDKEKIKRFMPSDYLITHEWEKHGTCSGLSRSKYYALTELLWDGLKLPDLKAGEYSPAEVRQMVIDSNPAVLPNMIELACDDNGSKPNSSDDTLDEIRICYSKDGQFMSCTEREKSCDVIDSVEVRSID